MSMKRSIVLIHPPLSFEERYGASKSFTGHIHPPQGLCHLAAMFPAEAYQVAIIDAQALFMGVEDTVRQVVALKPHYVGIMTFTISVHTVARLTDLVREALPGVRVILGGPHMSARPEETFQRYPQFDLAVLGEGEVTLPELIACLEQGKHPAAVPGILYRDDQGEPRRSEPRALLPSLDALPMPRWDLLPHLPEHYRPSTMTFRELPAVAVVTSRGCPHECTFCDRSVFGRRWRAHGPETVLGWIDHLVASYGIRDINFQDDHFMVDKKRLAAICAGIKERHPGLLWSTIGRADAVDRDSVRLMKDAGCWQIAFGIESGSQQILDVLKKNETIEQIEEAVRIIKEAGMTVKGLFMAGCPTETEQTLEETERFIRRLDLDYVSMSAFTPTPNTEVFAEWHKYGRWEGATPDEWHKMNLWEPIFIADGLSKEYLQQFIKRAPVKQA